MEDDIILPEDYVETPSQDSETTVEEQQEPEFEEPIDPNAEYTKPAEEPTEPSEPVEQPQKIKIKFNHEERELDIEEAAQLAQKGMVFDKAIERERQQARDSVIAEMGYTWNDKPITTEAEYKQAMMEQKIIEQYKDRDLPPEVIQELMESRRDREERQREKVAQEEQAKKQTEYNEFFQYFESVNDRKFDPEKDSLPPEVMAAVEKGANLKYAYMEHHNKELRNRLKIQSQNQANKQKAPVGSVTVNGGTNTASDDLFLEGFNSI